MPSHITGLSASQRLDSSSNPAFQVKVTNAEGTSTSIVPVANVNHVSQAIRNISQIIAPALPTQFLDVEADLFKIDAHMAELKGEKGEELHKEERLGVSIACARAGAHSLTTPLYEHLRLTSNTPKPYILPVPFLPILDTSEMEFSIAPLGATSFASAVKMATGTINVLRDELEHKSGHLATNTTPTNTFSIPLLSPTEALHLLAHSIHTAGHTGAISISLSPSPTCTLTGPQKVSLFQDLLSKYPITLLEDPVAQDECQDWAAFMQDVRSKGEVAVVDLGVTSKEVMTREREKGVCNGVAVKNMDYGSVSEIIENISHAYNCGFTVFLSSSMPETTDDFIADLSVGLRTGAVKLGAERVGKLNRLLDIEEELKLKREEAIYAGKAYRSVYMEGRGDEGKRPLNVYGY